MFDLLFPTVCLICSRPGEYICTLCKKKLKKSLPECYICRKISPGYITHSRCNPKIFNKVFIAWRYDQNAKKILSQFKYRYAYRISKILTDLLLERMNETGFIKSINRNSILCPIPSHISHLRKRGFNQSALIANNLSKRLSIPVADNFLIRDKDSRYQSHLNLENRKSLKDVFKIAGKIPKKEIILIDDVITTATTINKAGKTIGKDNLKAIGLFRGNPHYSQRLSDQS